MTFFAVGSEDEPVVKLRILSRDAPESRLDEGTKVPRIFRVGWWMRFRHYGLKTATHCTQSKTTEK